MTDEAREFTPAEALENHVERFLEYQSKSKKLSTEIEQAQQAASLNDERMQTNREELTELLELMVGRKDIDESGAISIGQCVLIYNKSRITGNTFKVTYTIHTPTPIDSI